MTTPEPLDLKLTDTEMAAAQKYGSMSNITIDRFLVDAATAKAALGVVAWLGKAFADATEEKGAELNGDQVVEILTDFAVALRASGIRKPE